MDRSTEDSIMDRLSAIEAKVGSEYDKTDPKDWMMEAFHTPGIIGGIVVDEGKARESDCRRISLGDDSYLTYSKGVVGALNRDQEKLYCDNITDVAVSPEVAARTKIMRDVTVICQGKVQNLASDERLEVFMPCLVQEAKKRGLEI